MPSSNIPSPRFSRDVTFLLNGSQTVRVDGGTRGLPHIDDRRFDAFALDRHTCLRVQGRRGGRLRNAGQTGRSRRTSTLGRVVGLSVGAARATHAGPDAVDRRRFCALIAFIRLSPVCRTKILDARAPGRLASGRWRTRRLGVPHPAKPGFGRNRSTLPQVSGGLPRSIQSICGPCHACERSTRFG